jgi:uncharacterized membrane protein
MDNKPEKSGKKEKPDNRPAKEVDKPTLDLSGIPDDIARVIKELPEEERTKFISAFLISVRKTSYSGPIPHPDIAKGWNDIVENGAERIMKQAETQLNHRIELEDFAVREQHRQSSRGQLFGLIIALVCIGAATFLSINGHDVVAGLIGGSTILGLVTVFVTGKRAQVRDLQKK